VRQGNPDEVREGRDQGRLIRVPRGAALVDWIASRPVAERDRAVEELLGIAGMPETGVPGPELIGYVPSGIAPIVRAVLDVPITADDTLVVLGAGLGKVLLAVHLLTGARARGVEIQPALVARSRKAALPVDIALGDARTADVSDATVVYFYLPFTGSVLDAVAARLTGKCVCTLGIDLPGRTPRPTSHFWLSIYDGADPRTNAPVDLGPHAEAVADER